MTGDELTEALQQADDAAGGDQPAAAAAGAEAAAAGLPDELPLLPLRQAVLFPLTVQPLVVGRERSVKLVDEVLASGKPFGVVMQRSPDVEEPGPDDLHSVGTVATILKMVRQPEGSVRMWVQGLRRFRISGFSSTDPHLVAAVEEVPRVVRDTATAEALRRNAAELFSRLVAGEAQAEGFLQFLQGTDEPGDLADIVSGHAPLGTDEGQRLLETEDVEAHLRALVSFLNKEVEVRDIGDKIKQQAQDELERRGREAFLREQMRAIQSELGEGDQQAKLVQDLKERVDAAGMPEEVEKVARDELRRLESTPAASPEHGVIRNYIEWLVDLPWSRSSEETLDIAAARETLDRDHTGLDQVKERIVEYLSVLKLRQDLKGPVLCLVGPPGVGKTSLGRSIAEATGRPYVRLSLGGVRDEAEIRGHRRTYIGAMPGRIIQAMKKAGANNPVFVLDELDKLGSDFRGDPSDALLEVLDPEQNSTFSDHYVEVPFDLSKVLFLGTANVEDTIPPPLKDRLEIIRIPGYVEDEKVEIARRHILPKQLRAHGLAEDSVTIADEALHAIARDYTRENGLRNLERQIANICRKVARRHAEGDGKAVNVTAEDLKDYLGPRRFHREMAGRTGEPGVATALAWTPTGGEILFVEATSMAGPHRLLLTGQLGEVMKESAQAALSWILSHAGELGLGADCCKDRVIHLHVPAGAVPKDGPSAGVTMVAALTSLLRGVPVRPDVAMTGEITLRGRVLPVGGIKEKVLAARRAGIKEVILPDRNDADLEEIDETLREGLRFHLAGSVDEVLALALVDGAAAGDAGGHEVVEAGSGRSSGASAGGDA